MSGCLMNHPWSLILLGSQFTPFAVAAYVAIACLALRSKLGFLRLGLLAVFGVFMMLEYMQLSSTGRSFAAGADVSGYPRYFGALAPLLWIFAACGAAYFWTHSNPNVNVLGRVALVAALGWVVFKANLGQIIDYKTKIQSHDTEVAVAQLAPKILEDYLGPREQHEFKRSPNEYYTGLRPVVSCPFGAAGWAVRGDHCRVTGAKCPYREDYLCFPLGSRYAGITNIDVRIYKYITSVPGGLGTQWMLFRRRLTPGRKK